MRWQDHIEQKPDVMLGKPVVKGTRITVEHILERLGDGWSIDEVVAAHPGLRPEHVRAALQYAARALASDEQVFLRETA